MDLQEFRLEFSVEAEQEKKTTEYKKKKAAWPTLPARTSRKYWNYK